jgi:hypothetical protein
MFDASYVFQQKKSQILITQGFFFLNISQIFGQFFGNANRTFGLEVGNC